MSVITDQTRKKEDSSYLAKCEFKTPQREYHLRINYSSSNKTATLSIRNGVPHEEITIEFHKPFSPYSSSLDNMMDFIDIVFKEDPDLPDRFYNALKGTKCRLEDIGRFEYLRGIYGLVKSRSLLNKSGGIVEELQKLNSS